MASAFANAVLENSEVNNDLKVNNGCVISHLNYNITMQGTNSEAVEITTMYNHEGKIKTQLQQGRRVTFANEGNSNLNKVDMLVPNCLSRLNTSRGTKRCSTGSTASAVPSQRTTTTDVASLFMIVPETQESLIRKLQIQSKTIRNYMRSTFFYELEPGILPLWNPAPASVTCHPDFLATNLCVGDVGFFNDRGGFEVQFNIFLSSAKNDELGFDPPVGFQEYGNGNVNFCYEVSDTVFVPPDDHQSRSGKFQPSDFPGTFIASYHLSRGWLPKRVAGSILYLPNGFWSDRIRSSMFNAVNNYIGRHAQSWYDHYDNKGPINTKDHCLKIITTSYKCDAWALAACSTASSDKIFARLRLRKSPEDRNPYYQWEKHDKVRGNTGTAPFPNQCVAVEVYAIESSTTPVQTLPSKLSHLSRRSLSTR